MAVKQYGYYIKGNKLALVEKDTSFDNDVTSKEYGPGSDRAQWKSAKTTIDKGLEIEYTYAPTYNTTTVGVASSDVHRFIGWGSDGTNLLLFTYATTDFEDISSLFSADQWILIEGGGRWSGLHKVKSATSEGILTTYTKCSLSWSKLAALTVSFVADETITSATAAKKFETIKELETRDTTYIFIAGTVANANNKGVFKITLDTSDSTGATLGTAITKYGKDTSTGAFLGVDASLTAAADDADVDLHNLVYDEMFVHEGVEVMEDETFELDLPDYLSRALLLYVKAQYLEDLGQFEMSEYFMSKFKKKVEEYMSTRHAGPKMVSGFWHMR